MSDAAKVLRQKAGRLLALALDARERGGDATAAILTEAAAQANEEAAELEATELPPPSPEAQQPVAQQQQQQIQSDEKQGGKE